MDELHASNAPLVDKESGSCAVILPAQTMSPLNAVHYKTSNNSGTTTSTAEGVGVTAALPTCQQGSGAETSASPLTQLQALPLQKTNDLKQCNAVYG